MTHASLVLSALRRRPARTLLTLLSLVVAFVLFGALHGLTAGFDSALDEMDDSRLRVISRANLLEPLPISHLPRIERIPGVKAVAHASILIGYYQQPQNQMVAVAADVDRFRAAFKEMRVTTEALAALRTSRTAALVGNGLAARYGLKVGDRVTLHAFTAVREDGSPEWTFDIVGLVSPADGDERGFANELYFAYDYFDEARATGKGTVHQFAVLLDDPAQSASVALAIDAEFANSPDETSTMNDRDYVSAQIRQIGDIETFVRAILGAVMFTLLYLVGNTMAQSVRERRTEFGMLKSLGFAHETVVALVFAEAVLLCVTGALVGIGLAALVLPGMMQSAGLPALGLPVSVWLLGVAIAAAIATAVSVLPAWGAFRLTVVEALSGR